MADYGNRKALTSELVALHNEGLIDVVEAFEHLTNGSPKGPDFFHTRHIFQDALADLAAPVLPVMRCVLGLYKGAGQDMAAGQIFSAYIDYCAKNPTRPRDALATIEACPEMFADLLTETLVAGFRVDGAQYLAQAIRLCSNNNVELRRRAIFAFSRFCWPGGSSMTDSAIDTLEHSILTETDDQTIACIVTSAFALLQQQAILEPRVVALITKALSKGDKYTIHAAADIFGFHTSILTEELLNLLLAHLTRVEPKNNRTLDNIDHGISHLLKSIDAEKAIRLLEDLLLAHSNELTMKMFDDAAREIHGNKALMSKVLTRWFLRGDRVLCEGVHEIIGHGHSIDQPLEVDPAELRPADLPHVLFVARKAIGYLFLTPLSAASILISLIRVTNDSTILGELKTLLFDPLLLNFTGKVREYVLRQSENESGQVKATIDQALRDIDNYLEALHTVGDLPALHPSESQREMYHRYISRIMADSWKAAEAQSVFLHLVTKSLLLYGRKSVNYVSGADGLPRRMEIPLRSHGTEMEIPRMEYLDSFGLNLMLRMFKGERLKS